VHYDCHDKVIFIYELSAATDIMPQLGSLDLYRPHHRAERSHIVSLHCDPPFSSRIVFALWHTEQRVL
jgi:hypothetical protein